MALYAYIDADGSRKVVDGVNLAFSGTWNGSTSYQRLDVADDDVNHHWVALITNVATALPDTFDTTAYSTWAHLVAIVDDTAIVPPVAGDWLPAVWAGTNYAEDLVNALIPTSGTIPTSRAVNGTLAYDFNGPAYQITTIDQTIHITGTNMSDVKEINLVLQSGSGAYPLTYDTFFHWLHEAPPSEATEKSIWIKLVSLGDTADTVYGTPDVEI